jgi:hypothetical protein
LDLAARALLAISLNEANLSVEHGAPVRLVVPGGDALRASNGSIISNYEASQV